MQVRKVPAIFSICWFNTRIFPVTLDDWFWGSTISCINIVIKMCNLNVRPFFAWIRYEHNAVQPIYRVYLETNRYIDTDRFNVCREGLSMPALSNWLNCPHIQSRRYSTITRNCYINWRKRRIVLRTVRISHWEFMVNTLRPKEYGCNFADDISGIHFYCTIYMIFLYFDANLFEFVFIRPK